MLSLVIDLLSDGQLLIQLFAGRFVLDSTFLVSFCDPGPDLDLKFFGFRGSLLRGQFGDRVLLADHQEFFLEVLSVHVLFNPLHCFLDARLSQE